MYFIKVEVHVLTVARGHRSYISVDLVDLSGREA